MARDRPLFVGETRFSQRQEDSLNFSADPDDVGLNEDVKRWPRSVLLSFSDTGAASIIVLC